MQAVRGSIEANLRAFDRARSTQSMAPAAVAIVVMDSAGRPTVPIFQRTSGMSRHASQMALPGGKLHEGETVQDAAIRELREELGLAAAPRDVIGMLDDFDTRSGFTITPVVIWSGADPAALQPSKFEVDELYLIPITELEVAVSVAKPGRSRAISLKLDRVEVFAPTGAILYQFVEVAVRGRPVRVADYYQPPFTHR